MSKILDFMEKQVNNNGKTVYSYRKLLGSCIIPPNNCILGDDPEKDEVEVIEISSNISYLAYRVAHDFPNLKKIIVQPSRQSVPPEYEILAFGD